MPALNNEKKESWHADHNNLRTAKFSDLNGAMLVMFDADTVIYPKETAWFQSVDTTGKVVPLQDSDFNKKDYVGLAALNTAGKVKFESFVGEHLQFSRADITNKIIPALKQ